MLARASLCTFTRRHGWQAVKHMLVALKTPRWQPNRHQHALSPGPACNAVCVGVCDSLTSTAQPDHSRTVRTALYASSPLLPVPAALRSSCQARLFPDSLPCCGARRGRCWRWSTWCWLCLHTALQHTCAAVVFVELRPPSQLPSFAVPSGFLAPLVWWMPRSARRWKRLKSLCVLRRRFSARGSHACAPPPRGSRCWGMMMSPWKTRASLSRSMAGSAPRCWCARALGACAQPPVVPQLRSRGGADGQASAAPVSLQHWPRVWWHLPQARGPAGGAAGGGVQAVLVHKVRRA